MNAIVEYHIEHRTGISASPVWWIMQGEERLAGVHWGLHDGKSDKAKEFAQKIVDALNVAKD